MDVNSMGEELTPVDKRIMVMNGIYETVNGKAGHAISEPKNIKGYEVAVKVPNRDKPIVYCVDEAGLVRSWYEEGTGWILSTWEKWADEDGIAVMSGHVEKGGLVSILEARKNAVKEED